MTLTGKEKLVAEGILSLTLGSDGGDGGSGGGGETNISAQPESSGSSGKQQVSLPFDFTVARTR